MKLMDDTLRTCREFTEVLASSAPTPGGGGASALMGAIGVSLAAMVANLTIGKKKYADVEAEMQALESACQTLRVKLLDCARKDAEGFQPLARAYGIPKDDPTREETLENATLAALAAPMEIMELCCRAIDAADVAAHKGSRLAVSDAGCAAACCRGALESASLNVFINTSCLKNREIAEELEKKANNMLENYCKKADEIFAMVKESFN